VVLEEDGLRITAFPVDHRPIVPAYGYRFDANQEFLALAASNLGAGLGRGLPVSGGMSQSLVNESGGARNRSTARSIRLPIR